MTQLLIVLMIALVIFGSKRLKNVGGDLGHAIRSFRKAVSAPESADDKADTPDEPIER